MTTTREELLARIPAAERRLDLAGIPTALLQGGDGPPVVLLHGQGEFAATWMRVVPGLLAAHSVVVPDLPGHGASGSTKGDLGRERMSRWLAELLALTCPEPPVLVGHLLGGALAARFALRHPDRISGLVLVDTLGLRWYRPAPAFAIALAGFLARPTARSRDRLFDQCFVDLGGIREQMRGDMELLEDYALECARNPEQGRALRLLMPRLGLPPIPPEELAQLPVPTALIWGRNDRQTPVSTAQAAAARHGWPLHVIDGSADDPAHEQPETFLRALASVLTDIRRNADERSAR